MRSFPLCASCQAEVDDPEDRRFHSQTNCCLDCGPRLSLRESGIDRVHEGTPALDRAVALLAQGGLLAVKGLGGFHLMARADQPAAIERIRQLKRRQRKPLAVMFATLDSLARYCRISEAEQRQLCSSIAPIVLLQRQARALFSKPPGAPFSKPPVAPFSKPRVAPFINPLVAPGLDRLGAMLAYTPLHHLLLQGVGVPLLATSANPRGEPLCYRNQQAVDGFADNIDAVLSHDRDIQQPLDDSIVQIAAARPMTLRRARGFDLQCAELDSSAVDSLAVGADLKNCIALNRGREILSAPHIGDLNSLAAEAAHAARSQDLCELYGLQPQQVICDLHPAYSSRRLAIESGLPLQAIQHHRAHLYAVLAENPAVQRPLLAAIWDGTGYGDDGTVWGGEFFLLDQHGDRRLACLAPFHLPGGEQAIREPRRMALSLLFTLYGEAAIEHPALPHFTAGEKQLLLQMLQQQVNSPLCSSAGRLFDGVAALLGIHPRVDYEGEAAICLEQLAARCDTLYNRCNTRRNNSTDLSPYPFELDRNTSVWQLNWRPMVHQLLQEAAAGHVRAEQIAARFHLSLAHGILAIASAVGSVDVLVGGGCFQNRLLLEAVLRLANDRGIRLHWPRDLPPGDGGIAAGQLYALLSGGNS
jgi:hydrogenase maturation protein HypF